MILDVERFIRERRAEWTEFEGMLTTLEGSSRRSYSLEQARRFHYLYERVAADLMKLSTGANAPETRQYLETLVARAFGEMHETSARLPFWRLLLNVCTAFPFVVRKHVGMLLLVLALFSAGGIFGAAVIVYDPAAKSVIMPFSHLLGDPSDRVAEEEGRTEDHMEGGKATFSAHLMTHNTKVAIFTLALGMTFGIGTGIVLFYNGVILGAVAMDYILAGETVFLLGWLLPHGSVELPAIFFAGQGGMILGRALLCAKGRMSLGERLRDVRGDLVTLIAGVAILLIWAGIIESYLSQYHEPTIAYSSKILFGSVQLLGLIAYLCLVKHTPAEPAHVDAI